MGVKAGVIGWPIDHSLSPKLHGYWLKKYGIFGTYKKIPVLPGTLLQHLQELRDKGYAGFNVTLPHKEETALLMDTLDPVAIRVGAVNTVVIDKNGKFCGSNTDAYGFTQNLYETVPDWQAKAAKAVVLGAGGSARAVLDGLVQAGVLEICILNRTIKKAEKLAQQFQTENCKISVGVWENNSTLFAKTSLLVNTTSLGMVGQPELGLDIISHLPKTSIVYDLVYNPLETGLLLAAKEGGCLVVTGLGMLIHQAVPGFKSWFGQKPEPDKELVKILTA